MKVLVLGDRNVGKTTWIYSLLGFSQEPKPTLGFEVHEYEYNGRTLSLWEVNETIRGACFLDAECAIIVYTDKSTVDKYKREILENTGKKLPYIAINFQELDFPEQPLPRLFKW